MSSRAREISFQQKLSNVNAFRERQKNSGDTQRVPPSTGVVIPHIDRSKAITPVAKQNRPAITPTKPVAPVLMPSTQKPSSRQLAPMSPTMQNSQLQSGMPMLPQSNFLPGPGNLTQAQIHALANGDSSFGSQQPISVVTQQLSQMTTQSPFSPTVQQPLLTTVPPIQHQPTFVNASQQLPTGPPIPPAPPVPNKPPSRPSSVASNSPADFEVDINEVLYKVDHGRIIVSIAGLQGNFNLSIPSVAGNMHRVIVSDNHLTPEDTDFEKFEMLFDSGDYNEQEVMKIFLVQAKITFLRPAKVTAPAPSVTSSVSPSSTPSTTLMRILTYFFGNLISTNNNELIFDQASISITVDEEDALYEKHEILTDYFVKGNTLALIDGKMVSVKKSVARRDMIVDIPIAVLSDLFSYGFVNHLSNPVRYSLEQAGVYVEPINRDGIIVYVRAYEQHIFDHILDNAETLPIGMVPL